MSLGMVEHSTVFMPMVTGDEVQAERSLEQIASETVEFSLARYEARSIRVADGF